MIKNLLGLRQLKMAIIIRNDLKLTKGKIASQASHAAVLCYQKALDTNKKVAMEWSLKGQPKIVLKVDSQSELEELYSQSKQSHLTCALVRDAGRTQIESGTATALGIGPDYVEKIDSIVKHLKLL